MNTIRSLRLLRLLLLGLMATWSYSGVASAQVAATHATFSLPFEVHWGRVILQPGQYTLTLSAHLNRIVSVRGNNQTVMLPAQDFWGEYECAQSSLTLVRSGSIYMVRALSLGRFGVFWYWPPKSHMLLARKGKGNEGDFPQAPELIQRLPVLIAEK